MRWNVSKWLVYPLALGALAWASGCGGPEKEIELSLKEHVLFFSNFEKGVDALSCAGSPLADIVADARTRTVPEGDEAGGHLVDGYLVFEKDAGALSYAAKGNFPYSRNTPWSGGVSFWLSTDTSSDLEGSFAEPFHIGRNEGNAFPWNDAVVFVDFDNKNPPPVLRFGCYPNKEQEITDEMVDRRVIRVENINWKRNKWHHIAITWTNFNSGKSDAEWALFIDGVEKGRKKGIRQDITWNMNEQVVRFNHDRKYVGKMDEIAIFDKMLTSGDTKYLSKPRRPLNVLLKKDR